MCVHRAYHSAQLPYTKHSYRVVLKIFPLTSCTQTITIAQTLSIGVSKSLFLFSSVLAKTLAGKKVSNVRYLYQVGR